MTILAIVPGISKVCLLENLVDCADCGGLVGVMTMILVPTTKVESISIASI